MGDDTIFDLIKILRIFHFSPWLVIGQNLAIEVPKNDGALHRSLGKERLIEENRFTCACFLNFHFLSFYLRVPVPVADDEDDGDVDEVDDNVLDHRLHLELLVLALLQLLVEFGTHAPLLTLGTLLT